MANVIKHKRGSGSDPVASDLVVGEVAIRTDVGKLFTKMDNGSVAEIAGGGSDIIINTLSSSSATGGGSATFNGSAYRFTLSQPPSVSAQQLLVSINGVIQKPVAGTGQPSEGFSVDGTDIILGDAPATGSDFFILTFKSLGVSEPADNSVTSAKIVDGAIVNADINASAAIAGSKISPNFGSQAITGTGNLTIDTNTLHVDSSNNRVGIGTTSPESKLSVDGSVAISSNATAVSPSGYDLKIRSDTSKLGIHTDSASGTPILEFGTGGATGGFMYTSQAQPLRFGINASEKARIDSSGRLLLGTTTEGEASADNLTIADSGNAGISIRTGTTSTASIYFSDAASGTGEYDGFLFYSQNTRSMSFGTATTTKMTIDSSGNVGIGTASPQVQLDSGGASSNGLAGLSNSTFYTGFTNTGGMGGIVAGAGANGNSPFIAASKDGNGNALKLFFQTDGTIRQTIDTSGNVGIGLTTPQSQLELSAANDTIMGIQLGRAGSAITASRYIGICQTNNPTNLSTNSGFSGVEFGGPSSSDEAYLAFHTHDAGVGSGERFRIDKTGNIVPADSLNVLSTLRTQGQTFVKLTGHSTSNFSVMVFGANDGGHNTGTCAVALGKASNTGRSLNAAGTVNASGNDYAEYMTKSSDFTLAKGDICGIDANGKLTNKFSESISFVVKSTDPSYVGGDAWGTEEVLGEKPADDSDDLPAYEEKYEAARKMVDRIAFSGQVPVNVTGTTPGQHIIPTAGSEDAITGVAKTEKDLSMSEYMSSIGKVIALESDGRAKIIVKVA